MTPPKLTTCLWFDDQALPAAEHYTSIFPDSSIEHVQHYPSVGQEVHGKPAGSVQLVSFSISGKPFVALNGGPNFKHSEAVSFMVDCKDQGEVDYYWDKLGEGGDEKKQVCGWLADKFGISWQVVPKQLMEWMKSEDRERANRVMSAFMKMKKFDLETLRKAFEGEE
ncbi:putative 3-demethylubiquinone-9 3-methyltransferase [Polyplosphaeria fusca]|uniref:3-demethylubiquinone-9 3-methyltransferase n=1 Tax=Polyplosphaeria fusca TaxID=682080 RepID=A0A9P4R4C7_9PLEO|nr:putative 3-demethylubiquinone-9 3-methyltransferase [Polyplosphaeria fusca]